MRWLVGLTVLLLALGTLRMVGCGEEAPECLTDEDCDDQYDCTTDFCSGGRCYSDTFFPFGPGGRACVRHDGVAGVCYDVGGGVVCAIECQTDEQCNDGLECTSDFCDDSWYPENPLCAAVDTCWGFEDDGNECTVPQCSRYSGECEHVPADGRPCAYSCGPCPFPTLCSGAGAVWASVPSRRRCLSA